MTDAAPASPPPRISAIDALRGAALLGMFVFHFTWDLGFFGLIPREFPYSPGFMFFGHIVASAFLGLAGASLALSARGGLDWEAFWKRFAMISISAAAITASTYYLFPDSFIFFGILHCIAAASLAALALLRAPLWLVCAAAGAVLAAPLFIASPLFDSPALLWTGLGGSEPRSNDWRAFFPWAGFTLAGLAIMRLALARGLETALASWHAGSAPARALAWGGRHSLLVYLVHQPVFLALVYGASLIAQPEAANYQRACETRCGAVGGEAPFCARACNCVADRAKRDGLWPGVLKNQLSGAESLRFDAISRECARGAAP